MLGEIKSVAQAQSSLKDFKYLAGIRGVKLVALEDGLECLDVSVRVHHRAFLVLLVRGCYFISISLLFMVNNSCLIVLSRKRNVAEPEHQDKIYLHLYSHSIIIYWFYSRPIFPPNLCVIGTFFLSFLTLTLASLFGGGL